MPESAKEMVSVGYSNAEPPRLTVSVTVGSAASEGESSLTVIENVGAASSSVMVTVWDPKSVPSWLAVMTMVSASSS